MRIVVILMAGLAAGWAGLAGAQTAEEDATVFGALPIVLDISLSPSGNKVAFITSTGYSRESVVVSDLTATDPRPRTIANMNEEEWQLLSCSWGTETRLVCQARQVRTVDGLLVSFTRMLAIGDDGSRSVVLSGRDDSFARDLRQDGGSVAALDPDGAPNSILMTREWVAADRTGSRLGGRNEIGLGIEAVDVLSGSRTRVEAPDEDAIAYTADEAGRVRLKVRQPRDESGFLRDDIVYQYRDATSNAWRTISQATNDTAFSPVAVDAANNRAYGFVEQEGYTAVATLALDGSGHRDVLLARGDVDVDRLIRIGRRGRVVGASFATEKREVVYFDEELKALSARLQAALPGRPLVDIVDASSDESKLLLIASSDTDPGTVYLYDKATRRLEELLPMRLALQGRTMAPMQPVTFSASDGTSIPGYLTLPVGSEGKNLPAVVLPHGGPGARDEWGFDWLVQFLAARGYAVLQPNYRGSTGYGSAWFGRNGFQAWQVAIDDVNAAGRWLVSSGVADPAKLGIVGWSYGGYAALQSQVVDPTLFKAVAAIAPVTDLGLFVEQSRGYTNYSQVRDFIGTGPHVEQGSPARHARNFAAPVLLVHGTVDENVAVSHSRRMESRLKAAGKAVEYLELDKRDHQIDDADARTRMLRALDAFLARALRR